MNVVEQNEHLAAFIKQDENPFTSAIRALSRLYMHASDTGNASLKSHAEAATRELLGWRDETKSTRVDFPPRENEVTRS